MILLEYHKDLVTLIGSFTKIRGLPTFTHFLSILHILTYFKHHLCNYFLVFDALFLQEQKKKKKKKKF